MKLAIRLSIFVLLVTMSNSSFANCRAEIGGRLPNMIGHVILFSSRGNGPAQPLMKTEFWGLSGPSDMYQLAHFPVRFEGEAKAAIETWDWDNYAGRPIIIRVLADGVLDGEHLWIVIREIFTSDDDYADALKEYPESRRGTCGSYFTR